MIIQGQDGSIALAPEPLPRRCSLCDGNETMMFTPEGDVHRINGVIVPCRDCRPEEFRRITRGW
jgi:hypothetical protein